MAAAPLGTAPRACATVALAVLLLAGPAPAARALGTDHRLPRQVTPVSQALRLDLDAGRPDFTGSTHIALRVNAATDSFQLHAQAMTLRSLALRARGRPVPATWDVDSTTGVLTVRTPAPLAPGAATLDLAFAVRFDTRADALYRLQVRGQWYLFTQFECIAARRTFPCWDEPEFKIPWQLTLTVPRAHRALSNTPIVRDSVIGARRRIVFERTPPMPSYLMAIATGPLESVPIPGVRVPARVVTVQGQKRLASYAARTAPAILARLEAYFGMRMPYHKLDLVAVPEFVAGAMENPGAITFRDAALLMEPATMSGRERRRFVTGAAHEMSHLWFGDLVTMRWWDDLWLNESFASWLGDKVSQQVAPEFNLPLEELGGTHRAMIVDARPSTHAMRQRVDAFDNLDDLFDALAYQKGQSVLGMLEHWLGEDTFRTGVRDYLARHAWGNAVAADLWAALSKASGRDVAGVAGTFLEQPGVPLVTVAVEGRTVRLRQERFHNLGAEVPPARWRIPLTLKWSDGTTVATRTILLADSEQALTLPAAPVWIEPNAEERAYCRWNVPPALLETLADSAARALDPRERLGLVNDLSALLDAGLLRGDAYLRLLAHFGDDVEPQVVDAALRGADHARDLFVTPATEAAFAAWVRHTFGPAYERLGPSRVAGESETATQLRAALMTELGDAGRDPNVLQRARTLTTAYLADPASIDASLAEPALALAAIRGDSALFEAYRERFESTTLPTDRARLLAGMAAFREPAVLARALDYTLAGTVRPNEIVDVFVDALQPAANKAQVFDWTVRNYRTLAARVAPYQVTVLARAAGGCSAERIEAGRAFFLAPAHRRAGMEKEFAKVADATRDCLALAGREGAAVTAYLLALARSN